ncbi:hypothetical protein OROHE_023731 [Orobanche hederae]
MGIHGLRLINFSMEGRVIRLPWLERGNQSCHEIAEYILKEILMLLMIQDAVSKGDDEVFAETSTGATTFQLLCGHEHDILLELILMGIRYGDYSELDMNVMMDRSILGRNMG